jgi:hypothetical protein
MIQIPTPASIAVVMQLQQVKLSFHGETEKADEAVDEAAGRRRLAACSRSLIHSADPATAAAPPPA